VNLSSHLGYINYAGSASTTPKRHRTYEASSTHCCANWSRYQHRIRHTRLSQSRLHLATTAIGKLPEFHQQARGTPAILGNTTKTIDTGTGGSAKCGSQGSVRFR